MKLYSPILIVLLFFGLVENLTVAHGESNILPAFCHSCCNDLWVCSAAHHARNVVAMSPTKQLVYRDPELFANAVM